LVSVETKGNPEQLIGGNGSLCLQDEKKISRKGGEKIGEL